MRQMGERSYYRQVVEDECRQHHLKVTAEVDVTSIRDYMLVRQQQYQQQLKKTTQNDNRNDTKQKKTIVEKV